ncbi:LysR family transcriptional regulator [Oxalobacteraceae bacterium CAVE-383]|nr:LysR family transcriptional regulator [Oxalobacteraceae bacterium CAVE-383]
MAISNSIRIRIIADDTIAFGPGKASLLQAIARSGSISGGAREMGMSYRRAWLLVEQMNRCFKGPLVQTATGGIKGGGAQITELAQDVLAHYQAMQQKAAASTHDELAYLQALMRDSDA